jgi:hypothetical protein
MKLDRAALTEAVREGLLDAAQAERLWTFLSARHTETPGFHFTHILYYLGGLVAIGAMSLFMTLGWERFGGWGLLGIASGYAVAGLLLANRFLGRGLTIPAGILATFVVVLTPLGVYGLQSALGWWPAAEDLAYREYHTVIDWRWMFMELATLASGALLLWRYRLPFLVMPIAVTLWYIGMDLTPFLFGGDEAPWQMRATVSMWFGLGMTLLAFLVDLRTRGPRDYPFWLYLFGVLSFWGGLTAQPSDSELARFGYLLLNLLLVGLGAALSRRVFAVFGGLGTAIYLGHLAYDVFKDSLLFPFALTAIGLGVIYAGVLWQRHEAQFSARLRAWLPAPVRELVERRG